MRKGMGIGLLTMIVAGAVVWGASEGHKNAPPSQGRVTAAAADELPVGNPAAGEIAIAQAGPKQPAIVRTEPSPGFFGPDPNDFFSPPSPPNLGPILAAPHVDDGPVDASAVDPAPLRARLLDEVSRKAELMSVDQLHQEIHREAATIRELQAVRELTRARQTLEALTKSHPETKAGKAAGNMLRSNPAADEFSPVNAGDARSFPVRPSDPFTPPRRRT